MAGEEITTAPEQPKAQIIDLFEALKQSLDGGDAGKGDGKANKEEAAPKPPKKAVPRKKKSKKKTKTG